jgi:hypothetical protein
MSKGLRNTFLVHVIVSLGFGLPLFFSPKTFESLMQWDPVEPALARVFGAALIALAVSSYLCFRAASWSEVSIVVVQEIAFTVLGVLAGLYQVFVPGAPTMIWLTIVIMAIFAGLWSYFYTQQAKM